MSHGLTTAQPATQRLWPRWVVANALSELVGLGATFVLIGLLFSRVEQLPGVGPILLAFGAAVASGAIEATVVGLAQWAAMHPWFPSISRFEWWRATLIGALLAYGLGYLPSTVLSVQETTTQTTVEEPPQLLMMLLAAGLGAVGGVVLAAAQWWVLRRHVERAWQWLPANMLAWAAGMPLIFWGIDMVFARPPSYRASRSRRASSH